MRERRSIILVIGGLIIAVGLFIALRPDDGGEPTNPTTRGATPAPTTARSTTPTNTRTQPPVAKRVEVKITVRGGKPVGGIKRATVKKGARVLLVVGADVVDEVHLHGYDISRDVAPGAPVRLAFRARLVGVFEVELEQRKLPIAELEVRP